jgi:hypothetical protein
MSNKRSEADKLVESFLIQFIKYLGYIFNYFLSGVKMLLFEKNKYKLIIVSIAILLSLTDILFIYPNNIIKKDILNIIIFISPLLCIATMGYMNTSNNKFEKEFKEISFYTRGEKTPRLVYKADKINLIDEKYRVYVFKTLIPLSKWISYKESIENILSDPKKDYTQSINHIERSGSQKIKIYTTYCLSGSYDENPKIKIDWDDNLLSKKSDSIIHLGIDKLYLNRVMINLDDKNLLIAGEPGSVRL